MGIYVLKEEVEVFTHYTAITSPNAQLVSASSKKILESGIHGFWENIYVSLAHARILSVFNLPKDPIHSELITRDVKDKRERDNSATFGNSLIKSSFYLYLGGLSLAVTSFIFEVFQYLR